MSSEVIEEVIEDNQPEVPESQEPAPEAPVSDPTEEAVAEAEAAAGWEPDYSFNVRDEKKEFDEWIRPVIKDASTQEQVRELYEKAYGLEHVKAERGRLREELGMTKKDHQELTNSLEVLSEYIDKKDYHAFFNDLKISEEDIINYALQRVQYQEATPEQRAQMDFQWERDNRLTQLERQNRELSSANHQREVQQRESELDMVLQRPEINQVMQAYDSRMGKVGSFREEAIKRGQYYALTAGQDISAEQAVTELMNLVGGPGSGAPASAPAQAQVVPEQKPVIPNIAGRGTSPIKKVPASIDDLRAMYKDS